MNEYGFARKVCDRYSDTPGPWVEGEASKDNWYVYAEKGTTIVAELERGDDGSPEHRCKGAADARLIAAAPRMLEFVQEYLARLDVTHIHDELAFMARAILRDVEGDK